MDYIFEFNEIGYDSSSSIVFSFGEVGVSYFYLLQGTDNLNSIWADESASINVGKFYTSSAAALNVVDIENEFLYDWYTQAHAGRTNEALDSNDIVDINKG